MLARVAQTQHSGAPFSSVMAQQVLDVGCSIAASTRCHTNEVVPCTEIRALLARRGIALDKQPGLRPIGVGECRQRIKAKATEWAMKINVKMSVVLTNCVQVSWRA